MPRFSKKRNRRSRRSRRTGRSRRGGAITIPDTGLTEPINIYYSSKSEEPSKPVRLTTIKTNNPNTPFICEIVDNNSLDKKTKFEDCNLLRKNAYSEEDFFKMSKERRLEYLKSAKAVNNPFVNNATAPVSANFAVSANSDAYKANEMFEANYGKGASERSYSIDYPYNGGFKRIKRRKTQKRRRR